MLSNTLHNLYSLPYFLEIKPQGIRIDMPLHTEMKLRISMASELNQDWGKG